MMSVSWVMPVKPIDLIIQWNGGFLGPPTKCFWSGLVHRLFWGIWKERNQCIFELKRRGVGELVDSNFNEVAS